jgi:hypothetical protein
MSVKRPLAFILKGTLYFTCISKSTTSEYICRSGVQNMHVFMKCQIVYAYNNRQLILS